MTTRSFCDQCAEVVASSYPPHEPPGFITVNIPPPLNPTPEGRWVRGVGPGTTLHFCDRQCLAAWTGASS